MLFPIIGIDSNGMLMMLHFINICHLVQIWSYVTHK